MCLLLNSKGKQGDFIRPHSSSVDFIVTKLLDSSLAYSFAMADFQNVSYFVFEQSIGFHKAVIQNLHMYNFSKRRQCIFLTQSKSNKASDL